MNDQIFINAILGDAHMYVVTVSVIYNIVVWNTTNFQHFCKIDDC